MSKFLSITEQWESQKKAFANPSSEFEKKFVKMVEKTVERCAFSLHILIIGQNPTKDQDPELPFVGTRSGQVLERWLKEAGFDLYNKYWFSLLNVWDAPGKLPPKKYLRSVMRGKWGMFFGMSKIICVGKVSFDIITELYPSRDILYIPHPSGLNRKLNDPKVVKKIVSDLRKFLA